MRVERLRFEIFLPLMCATHQHTGQHDLENGGWQAFTLARNSLRLTDAELPRGDKRYQQIEIPALQAKRLKEIEKQVELYLKELRKIVGNESLTKPTTPHGIILKYFTKYRDQIFGHPVIIDDNGTVIAVVQRTNNVD